MRVFRQRILIPAVVPTITLVAIACGAVAWEGEAPGERRDRPTLVAAESRPAGDQLAAPTKTSWASFRNGHSQLGVAGSKLPEKLELMWKKRTEHGVVATSAIVGDHVYVPALSGLLYCLDRRTGKEIWTYRSIESKNPEDFAPGFKAAPTVTADTVYVGDEDGVVHAVNRKTGKKRWIFKTDGEIAGGVAVVGEQLIIGSHDSFLYCLTRKDGKVHWKFQTMDRINCAPAIVGDYTFVAGCDEHLRVINIKTGKEKTDIPLKSYLIASPAVVGDILYVGTYKGEVVAVNWKTKAFVWRYKDPLREPEFHASAAVTDKYVVVGARDKILHCLDRKTGAQKWGFQTRAQINSSAAITGDRVFFGSDDRNIYGVRLSDGKPLWKFNAGGAVIAGPAIGENVLVVGAADTGGHIYCFGKKE